MQTSIISKLATVKISGDWFGSHFVGDPKDIFLLQRAHIMLDTMLDLINIHAFICALLWLREHTAGLQIRVRTGKLFSYFSTKTAVVGTQKNPPKTHV